MRPIYFIFMRYLTKMRLNIWTPFPEILDPPLIIGVSTVRYNSNNIRTDIKCRLKKWLIQSLVNQAGWKVPTGKDFVCQIMVINKYPVYLMQTPWTLIRLLLLREQSDLGPYCLQYRLPKCISRCESRQQLSRMVGKGIHTVIVFQRIQWQSMACQCVPWVWLKSLERTVWQLMHSGQEQVGSVVFHS